MATWLLIAKGFKISSLTTLIATTLSPLYFWVFSDGNGWLTLGVTFMAIMIFWRHESNIRNLLAGKEDKIQSKEGAESVTDGE
ncbi:MAG: glycerol-3-phosphate acyltransferase [Thiothrix sp.]